MDIESFRNYCLAKPGVTESFPFGEDTLVFKVMEKMFALSGLQRVPTAVNLKCNPERAIELREAYPEDVLPGYHMNKKHWNTVVLEGELADKLIIELTNHSYDLVVKSLRKKDRVALEDMT